MSRPGTKVVKLENPVIGFGGGAGDTKQKYGGYPYSLDFSLSLMDPSRITISFISEDRKYDITALQEDIIESGTKSWAQQIQYCGGGDNTFYGYPLKYSVNRSPRGDILTVDYYDASIVELDNCFVLLNGEDFPLVSNEDAPAGELPFNVIAGNPCEWGIFNLGRNFTRNSAGIPQSNPACIDQETLATEVLYTNHELAAKIKEHISVDEKSLKILSPSDAGGEEDPDQTFLENYHGTLREVLKQWGQRMGFTFYWDPKNPDGGGDRQKQGKLVFLDLKSGLYYDDLKRVADLMLGKTSGGSANLLDSTEAVSREQTFNKAISARYENAGIGDAVKIDSMMILDMLTLPIRGCTTDEGKIWAVEGYPRGLKTEEGENITGFEDGSPTWRWTSDYGNWYQEWDNANYSPADDADDTQERKWKEYQPKRPSEAPPAANMLDETGQEFRDYVRLVKAAAIGEDFFRAYVFFKAMKKSPAERDSPKTLFDVMQLNPSGTDANTRAMSCPDAVKHVLGLNLLLSKGGNVLNEGDTPETLFEDCCGKDAGDTEKNIEAAKSVDIIDPEGKVDDADAGIQFDEACGMGQEEGILIPDLVPNLALNKLIAFDPETGDKGDDPGLPNVKICRGTVVGADCLTVGVLDPCFDATKLLYEQLHGNAKSGCMKNEALTIEVVDEAEDVYRLKTKEGDDDADKVGSPYVFTHVYNFGNSLVLNDQKHDALYRQLKFVAENAGRFWVSSEPVTEREYRRRSYDEDGISWTNKLLDVNDSRFRGLFQTFDPIAPRSFAPFSEEDGAIYDQFWGEKFDKKDPSKQAQLNGFSNLTPPDDPPANPCDYDAGQKFSPSTTETGENTRAPTLEQMIQKIIDKNLNGKTGIPCSQTATMKDIRPVLPATWQITPDMLTPVNNDQGELTGYKLKASYRSPKDFFGGSGYGVHPEIVIDGKDIDAGTLSIKTIIHDTVITDIIIENAGDIEIKLDDNGDPDITARIDPPNGDALINFFKHIVSGQGGTSMDDMDSITSTNLSKRQEQREIACCCTDLEEGIVMFDAGELLIMDFNNETKKQIERIAKATNVTIGSQFSANLIKDYNRDNKVITMSTNLIPLSKIDASKAPLAEDELDWIVDQVRLGKIGADPSYSSNGFVMPTTPDNVDPISGLLECEMDTKKIKYIVKGEKFEAVVFGMVVNDQEGKAPKNQNGQVVKTVPAGTGNTLLNDCTGFIWADGVNVREMKIDFETPNSEDIGIEFECGREWIDLTKEEQDELLLNIQDNLIDYVKKRAYLQDQTSYEASATIADAVFLNKGGAPINFGVGEEPQKGIPSIKQGLEGLSIKVDGNGVRVTVSIGTRKKLLGLRDSNTNLWRELNPRTMNQLQINNPGGN
jgi:hypothetical protein